MSYEYIHNTLNAPLAAIPDVPTIITENEKGFLKSDKELSARCGVYLRSTLLPAETVEETIGTCGWNKWHGLFQIDLFYPYGEGTDKSNKLIDDIIAAYPQKDRLGDRKEKVHIRTVWRESAIQQTNFYMVPVVIRWDAWFPR